MLKEYHTKDNSSAGKSVAPVVVLTTDESSNLKDDEDTLFDDCEIRLNNFQVIANLRSVRQSQSLTGC